MLFNNLFRELLCELLYGEETINFVKRYKLCAYLQSDFSNTLNPLLSFYNEFIKNLIFETVFTIG